MPRWSKHEPYFWSLVDQRQEEACWFWLGGVDGKGYGRVWKDGKRQRAHRVAYEYVIGPIPSGILACHTCDNKLCVNPIHIFLGSQKDNTQDWTKKGKNKLANDRSLWSNGRWTKTKRGRAIISKQQKERHTSGKISAIRGRDGKIRGSRLT